MYQLRKIVKSLLAQALDKMKHSIRASKMLPGPIRWWHKSSEDGPDKQKMHQEHTNDANMTHQGVGCPGMGKRIPQQSVIHRGRPQQRENHHKKKRRKVGRMLMTTMPKQVKDSRSGSKSKRLFVVGTNIACVIETLPRSHVLRFWPEGI